jgi:hypothetical protein
MFVEHIIYQKSMQIFNSTNSTTRIVQRKIDKVPKNTKSTTKLLHITELCEILPLTIIQSINHIFCEIILCGCCFF